ncbi:MAG: OmpH family outer membrane protein [Acidimicrobiia bacterium]|nr:OmpH family outer membrane protein [Acidimicrobiia bacterium]
MRGLAIAASLGFVLSAAPGFAQAPAGQAKPAAPAPPRPAAPAPTTAPQLAPTPQAPAPFPQGAKLAFVNLQVIAQLSADGKVAAQKVNALTTKKQAEIGEKSKALQANQTKLQTGGGVMSDTARGQLEKEIDRQQRDLERMQQDAQAELNELQQDLQNEFQKKLLPILAQISKEKGLHFLFSGSDAGLIWAEEGLDLTQDAVAKLDAAEKARAK